THFSRREARLTTACGSPKLPSTPKALGKGWLAGPYQPFFHVREGARGAMLLVEVRRLDVAPSSDQFWTIVSRINGPEFMGVLYRAREAIFDSAGISFTIDLLS